MLLLEPPPLFWVRPFTFNSSAMARNELSSSWATFTSGNFHSPYNSTTPSITTTNNSNISSFSFITRHLPGGPKPLGWLLSFLLFFILFFIVVVVVFFVAIIVVIVVIIAVDVVVVIVMISVEGVHPRCKDLPGCPTLLRWQLTAGIQPKTCKSTRDAAKNAGIDISQ